MRYKIQDISVAYYLIFQEEAAETLYWLELLNSCSYIPDKLYQSLYNDCSELLAILSSSIHSCTK